MADGNIYADIAPRGGAEQVTQLLASPGARIERIVSHGHASPPGFWYDQANAEWVLVLEGAAGVRFDGEAEARVLRRGDHLLIPAHASHRVDWTDSARPTLWLAVHLAEPALA